ncbi:MAG: hypothetical protein EB053_06345 [Chlamydiae bacterium]|nr:hypothetical protein [Chlamydiota bacterium]
MSVNTVSPHTFGLENQSNSNFIKNSDRIVEFALKVLKSLARFLFIWGFTTIASFIIYGGHPIATSIGCIVGIWNGLCFASDNYCKE